MRLAVDCGKTTWVIEYGEQFGEHITWRRTGLEEEGKKEERRKRRGALTCCCAAANTNDRGASLILRSEIMGQRNYGTIKLHR